MLNLDLKSSYNEAMFSNMTLYFKSWVHSPPPPPTPPPLHDGMAGFSISSKMQSLYGSDFPELKNIDVLQVSGIVLMIHKLYISMVEWNFIWIKLKPPKIQL